MPPDPPFISSRSIFTHGLASGVCAVNSSGIFVYTTSPTWRTSIVPISAIRMERIDASPEKSTTPSPVMAIVMGADRPAPSGSTFGPVMVIWKEVRAVCSAAVSLYATCTVSTAVGFSAPAACPPDGSPPEPPRSVPPSSEDPHAPITAASVSARTRVRSFLGKISPLDTGPRTEARHLSAVNSYALLHAARRGA